MNGGGGLHIPHIDGLPVEQAALAYAKAGWYLAPVAPGTKNPGSRLGEGWQHQTSRDPAQIIAWLAASNDGIALHAGRSGAVIIDVDKPENIPPELAAAIASALPPCQTTRPSQPGRGHYLFTTPPGRRIGNSTGQLGTGWGDIRGVNGVILAAPTAHPDGGEYRWQITGPVPELPASIASLLPDAAENQNSATDDTVAAFLTGHAATARPRMAAGPLTRFRTAIARGESRHNAAVASAVWACKEARAGYYPARTALADLADLFTASLAGESRRHAASEFAAITAWAVAQAQATPVDEIRAIAERDDPRPFTPGDPAPWQQAAAFITQLRGWLDLPDPAHVILTLAAAATRDLAGEPVWLMLVGAPSSGKTETIRLLDDHVDGNLNEVTAAGLLGWTKGKQVRPSGILSRIGTTGLVTFGDLSSLLVTTNGYSRDAAFGLLRRAYDGHVTRDVSPPGRVADGFSEQLSWSGRLTVVAAVTQAIDRYSVHADQLGSRWVYMRLAEADLRTRRRTGQQARDPELEPLRVQARRAASALIAGAKDSLPGDVPDDVFTVIEMAALTTCWGRGAVPRHPYGQRDIDGVAVVEQPPRVVKQLMMLGRGLLALGAPPGYAAGLLRRVGLDSMPLDRYAVLRSLALDGPAVSSSELARRAGLDRKVARMRAEELEIIGVIRGRRQGPDDEAERDTRPVAWDLHGPEGEIVRQVFADDEEFQAVSTTAWDNPPEDNPPGEPDSNGDEAEPVVLAAMPQPAEPHRNGSGPVFTQPAGGDA